MRKYAIRRSWRGRRRNLKIGSEKRQSESAPRTWRWGCCGCGRHVSARVAHTDRWRSSSATGPAPAHEDS